MKITLACTVLILTASIAFAQKVGQEDSLRGIPGVSVLVEKINSDAERDGLVRAQLQTDVELRLRKARIRVLENSEPDVPFLPQLYIRVRALKTEFGIYAFSVIVQVNDFADLRRKPSRQAVVTIWENETAGSVGSTKLRLVRDTLADVVDTFINDYLSKNPK